MENNNETTQEKIKDTNWGNPKRIDLPKEINDFLFNALKEHLKETNEKFGCLLNKGKQEEYTNHGEFLQVDEKTKTVWLFVKAGKTWIEPN